ncbi:hypothetical protein Tco_0226161 [Tanacetum coccineum]
MVPKLRCETLRKPVVRCITPMTLWKWLLDIETKQLLSELSSKLKALETLCLALKGVTTSILDLELQVKTSTFSNEFLALDKTLFLNDESLVDGLLTLEVALSPVEDKTLLALLNLKKTLILRDCAEALYENFLDYFRYCGMDMSMCLASETLSRHSLRSAPVSDASSWFDSSSSLRCCEKSSLAGVSLKALIPLSVNDSHALICPTALGTHLPICWGKVCILFLADLMFCEMLIRVEYGEGERLMPRQKMFKELDGKLKSICMQKGGRQPTGMVSPMAKSGGFTFVSDMIHAKGSHWQFELKIKLNPDPLFIINLCSKLRHGGYGYDVPTGRRDGVVSLTCEMTGLQCREDLALPDCATCVARVVTLLRRLVSDSSSLFLVASEMIPANASSNDPSFGISTVLRSV